MAIKVLDPDATPLTKGRYYGWIRSDRSRGARNYRIPVDQFHEYSFVRCALPTHDWAYVKALSKSSFEVMDSFQEVPDDSLYSTGVQAKFDNMTELGTLSDEQNKAEQQFFEEYRSKRLERDPDRNAGDASQAQFETGRRGQGSQPNSNPPTGKTKEQIEKEAEEIAQTGHQRPPSDALSNALDSVLPGNEAATGT